MILLTGGTGFVGRHMMATCAAEGRAVRVLSRRAAPAPLPASVTWTQGDLGDAALVRSALEGIETVIHAAALLPASGASPAAFHQVNVEGTRTLAGIARTIVKRFIFVSTAGVYGDRGHAPHAESDATAPDDLYSRTKLTAEQAMAKALLNSEVRWTILRPPGLYAGDRDETAALVHAVATKPVWLHGPRRVILQPTHVSDVVRAAITVSTRDDLGGEILNIGGARTLAFQELIAMVGARVGHSPRQVSLPAFRTVDRSIGIARARQRIGFEPMPLEAGLDATVAELRSAGRI